MHFDYVKIIKIGAQFTAAKQSRNIFSARIFSYWFHSDHNLYCKHKREDRAAKFSNNGQIDFARVRRDRAHEGGHGRVAGVENQLQAIASLADIYS